MEALPLLLAVLTAVTTVQACVLRLSGWQPKSLAERARSADIVLTAYTRDAFKQRRSAGDTYAAEFLVLNVLKGEHVLRTTVRRPPSAVDQRLINVTNFGEKTMCYADVNAGETYILFLTTLDGQLSAKYDDIFGAAVLYSQEKEDEVLRALGWRPWGEWTSCSATCDGGVQQRKRLCNDSFSCSKDGGEQRTCNTFPCRDAVDLLEAVDLRKTSKVRGTDRPSAFTILPSTGWSVAARSALPPSFPWEFSLLGSVRLVPATEGYLAGIYLGGKLQMGLHVGERTSLVFSVSDDIQVSFVTTMADGKWHQLAFSVSENLVTFYLDCREEARLPLLKKVQPVHGDSVLVVGNLPKSGDEKPGEFDRFQGEVEQLVITPDHTAARNQCSANAQPLVARPRGELPLMEEVRGGSSSSVSSRDYDIPLRGDIVDDEDFSFTEGGSGYSPDVDDDEDEEEDEDSDEYSDEEEDESSEEEEEEESSEEESSEEVSTRKPTTALPRPSKDVSDDEGIVEGSGTSPRFELEWSEWSHCTSTCGWGRRTRSSYCIDNGRHLEECIEAGEERKEVEVCFLQLCPTAGVVNVSSTAVSPARCSGRCKNGGTCTSLDTCICTPGYGGPNCERASCRPGCLNGGLCTGPNVCSCPEVYTGERCETAVCKNGCQHGGQCVRPGVCLCRPGYSPPTCTAICHPSCRNGGQCVAANKCRCKPGFFGRFCDKAVCRQGCRNGGRCVATDKCACRSGYKGQDCGSPKCDPPCQNGGLCVKPYFCHCLPQTRGSFCEKFSCSKECQHGGRCVGPNKCSCPRGYKGRYCEEAFCPAGCLNGGKCKNGKCSCLSDYYGKQCEFRRCKYIAVQEPYQRGYKQKVTTTQLVPCGAWGWKQCTKTRVHYETIYKTFYRTTYKCVPGEKAKFWLKKG